MNKVKITVMKKARYDDLIKKYENHLEYPCNMELNKEYIIDKLEKPNDFCISAWETLYPFISDLLNEKGNFYDGWMKNKMSAMISCNDGFRPVSFYLEVIE